MKTRPGLTPFAMLAAVAATDAVARTRDWPRSVAGLLDESAHAATGALLLANWPGRDQAPAAGVFAGSVLLDVDHLPELWGRGWLRRPGARPVPHSLLTLAGVAAARRHRRGW